MQEQRGKDFPRPHPEVDIDDATALAWYLDGVWTPIVAKGGRILDWHSHRSGQLSDEQYLSRISQTDEQYREFRDSHR